MTAAPAALLSGADALLESVRAIPGRRRIVGITGPPGAGKSRVAAWLAATSTATGDRARVVPMDGFHLADAVLVALGRRDRKGAPDTFDADGFVTLLDRLRSAAATVYAPAFDRSIEAAIAGAIPVEPAVDLVVVEGNYLLLDDGPWAGVAGRLDATYYLEVPAAVRRRRLARRHRIGHGGGAEAWIETVDVPNAAAVEATRGRATAIVTAVDVPRV